MYASLTNCSVTLLGSDCCILATERHNKHSLSKHTNQDRKHSLYTKYLIKSNKATDPVTKLFFIKSNFGDPTLEISLKDEVNVGG